MIIPYHSIHSSSITITTVFQSPYYEDEAQVKCSLSKSDGDLNRFLTSWWVIPHTNHTHWLSELHITILQYPGPIRWFGRHRKYPRTVPATEVSKVYQGCMSCPHRSPQPSLIQRMVAWLPARIVFRLRSRNDLSFQLSVGHAFNMTKGLKLSVLNRHRQGHHGKHHHKTLPGLKYISTHG